MMTIPLTEDQERLVHEMICTGRYARAEDVIGDALIRLGQTVRGGAETSEQSSALGQQKTPLTKAEFHRHLVEIGLMDEVPETSAVSDDPDAQLIDNEGEIVSEMVIRERLIEWLIGFL
jgi:Arc/MetJ-type ribon-helix-helix transcriptional regulator